MDSVEQPADATDATDSGRRAFLQKAGLGMAVAWAAPVIVSTPAMAAGSLPPVPRFLAVGGDGSGVNLSTTDDGATWTPGGSSVADGHLHAVAYSPLGAGTWVAVGQDPIADSALIFTSADDGTTWTPNPTGQTGRLLGVTNDGAGNWVCVGQTITTFPGAPLIMYSSDDGVTWQPGAFALPPSPAVNQLHGIATDGLGTWIAVGQNNSVQGILTISTDNGATWSEPLVLDPANDAQIIGVSGDSLGNWIIGGSLTGPSNTAVMWYATGGNVALVTDWTIVSGIGSGFVYGIANDGAGTFVAVGQRDDPTGGGFSYTLNGGLAAGIFPGASGYQLHEVATNKTGVWIAVGYDSGGTPMRTFTSTDDGLNWSSTSSPGPGILLGISADIVE